MSPSRGAKQLPPCTLLVALAFALLVPNAGGLRPAVTDSGLQPQQGSRDGLPAARAGCAAAVVLAAGPARGGGRALLQTVPSHPEPCSAATEIKCLPGAGDGSVPPDQLAPICCPKTYKSPFGTQTLPVSCALFVSGQPRCIPCPLALPTCYSYMTPSTDYAISCPPPWCAARARGAVPRRRRRLGGRRLLHRACAPDRCARCPSPPPMQRAQRVRQHSGVRGAADQPAAAVLLAAGRRRVPGQPLRHAALARLHPGWGVLRKRVVHPG